MSRSPGWPSVPKACPRGLKKQRVRPVPHSAGSQGFPCDQSFLSSYVPTALNKNYGIFLHGDG